MEKKIKYVACLSGGQDSAYMLIWLLEHGYPIDAVIHVNVMATDDLSADFPEVETYLEQLSIYTGFPITYLYKGGVTFERMFYNQLKKGKKKGEIYGFPYTLGAWCQSRLKQQVLDRYFAELGPNHVRYVGITAEEPIRYERLSPNCCAPLYENGITSRTCADELRLRGLQNPLYEKFARQGCWFCPKQSLDSLRVLRRDYPDYWKMLLKWDADSPVTFKPEYTVAELDLRFREEELLREEEVLV